MSDKPPEEESKDPDHPENPGLLPYAHHVGSAIIRPMDKGKIKGRAMAAMVQQTERQFAQIKEQIDLLAVQARKLQDRIDISERIYLADMSFEPIHGAVYHLYEKDNGEAVLSMIGPTEWKTQAGYSLHLASVELLADHTWNILEGTVFKEPEENS